MNYKLLFWLVTAFTTLARLLIIGRIGLTGDEAHYWTYTTYPQLSYFDHPPFVAWLIKPFTFILGNTEFAVRLPAVLVFAAVSYIVYKLVQELYGEKTAFWSIALLNVMPVFSFLGAVVTMPDTPLSFFWMIFIYVFHRLVKDNKPGYWYILGGLLGLALLSKYNAVFLQFSAGLYLVCSKEHRFHLKRKEPYLALLLALAVFSPVIIWNIENSFASFGFQLQHGLGKSAPSFSAAMLAKCLGAQAGYVSPLLFAFFWWALADTGIKAFKAKDKGALLIFAFSFPVLFIFNAIASFNEILPHWPAMGYLVLSAGAANLAVRMWDRRWFRVAAGLSLALGLLISVIIPMQAMFKPIDPAWLLPKEEASRIEDGITKAEKIDLTNELYGWKEAGARINEIIGAQAGGKPFIFTHRHYIASQLSFYVPASSPPAGEAGAGKPRIFALSDRLDAYDFWQRDLSMLDGKDGVFVTTDYFYVDPSKVFPFKSWEKPVTLEIYRSGKKVRIFWITVGRQFDLKALPREYTSDLSGPKQTLMQAVRKADYRLFWLINRQTESRVINYCMWKVTKFDTHYGLNSSLLIMAAIVGVLLWRTKREKFLAEFILFIGIVGIGGVLIHLLKDYFCRVRPLGLFGDDVRVFHEMLERGSFPSGHTQIAFSVATYLSLKFKKYWWFFMIGAVLMGLSRVYVGMHFPVDVLGGALVGILVALIMMKLIKIE